VTPEAWKAEAVRLASEKDRLYGKMRVLRNEAKQADAAMRNVKRAMQPEQTGRRQVKRQDMEL